MLDDIAAGQVTQTKPGAFEVGQQPGDDAGQGDPAKRRSTS